MSPQTPLSGSQRLHRRQRPVHLRANGAGRHITDGLHPREITNPFLPLGSLRQDVLESPAERVFAHGKRSEITLDYFAQDDAGNVHYLGEDVNEYKNGRGSGHSGAWRPGRDTQTPGLLMPAHPKIGGEFMSEDVPKITWKRDEVVSTSGTPTVPAGTFANCVKIKEHASDGAPEYKYYAPGVGCIKEAESDGGLLLKSHGAE